MPDHTTIIDDEHEEMLEKLERAAKKPGLEGEIFKKILIKFKEHLEEENETIVPLLNYLKKWSDGEIIERKEPFIAADKKFNRIYGAMMEDHNFIKDLISELLSAKADEYSIEITHVLTHHIEMEEEFLYPAAKAAGEIIRFQKEKRR